MVHLLQPLCSYCTILQPGNISAILEYTLLRRESLIRTIYRVTLWVSSSGVRALFSRTSSFRCRHENKCAVDSPDDLGCYKRFCLITKASCVIT